MCVRLVVIKPYPRGTTPVLLVALLLSVIRDSSMTIQLALYSVVPLRNRTKQMASAVSKQETTRGS